MHPPPEEREAMDRSDMQLTAPACFSSCGHRLTGGCGGTMLLLRLRHPTGLMYYVDVLVSERDARQCRSTLLVFGSDRPKVLPSHGLHMQKISSRRLTIHLSLVGDAWSESVYFHQYRDEKVDTDCSNEEMVEQDCRILSFSMDSISTVCIVNLILLEPCFCHLRDFPRGH